MRKIFNLGIFLFLLGFFCGISANVNVFADEIAEDTAMAENEAAGPELLKEPLPHYVGWTFNTYAEPDFKAEKTGTYPPQDILILARKDDGWALIHTYKGAYWAYLNENKIYVDRYMFIYDNKGDTDYVSGIDPQVIKVIVQEENWLLIETWLGAKWIDLTSVRTSVLLDIPSYNQRSLGYPTGCEIVSTAMMINYTTEANVKTLASEMPRAQNPSDGFRGNPTSDGGFTIYPQALLSLTEKYLGSAQDMSGCEIEDLKRKLNENIPVVAWVNGLGFNVHAICLTGYDEKGLYYNDPWSGKKDLFITYDSFYKIWNDPIYDSIYGPSYPTRKALSYTA